MQFEALDWTILDRLRRGFLGDPGAQGPYWTSPKDLQQYDLTFGERIGWKWDAVLRELKRRQWVPPPGTCLDWGCGSGIAGRRVAELWPTEVSALACHDHSDIAVRYAVDRASEEARSAHRWEVAEPVATLVLSHVLNELSEGEINALLVRVRQATAVLWVEPGTQAVGRALAGIRDRLREEFPVIGPCTHANACPLFAPGASNHWCHAFAEPPKGIYADSNWVRFGQRAGVDLRSLPYSWLVLDRRQPAPGIALAESAGRQIGRASLSKADVRWLQCDREGLRDVKVTKRENPELWKSLDKRPGLPVMQKTVNPSSATPHYTEVFPAER